MIMSFTCAVPGSKIEKIAPAPVALILFQRSSFSSQMLAFDCVSKSKSRTRLPSFARAAAVLTIRDVFPTPPL